MMSAQDLKRNKGEAGFSLVEIVVALTVMMVICGAVLMLMRDSMRISSTTYEMTDAQQSLRNAQEAINRDLINAGDGLNSITSILVPRTFVTNYLASNPLSDPGNPGKVNLAIVNSDNNLAPGTTVRATTPAVTVRSNPVLTDRISILEIDPSFTAIPLNASAVGGSGSYISISTADVSRFTVGEVYFLTTSNGATLATITGITTGAAPRLHFAADTLGLNSPGTNGAIDTLTNRGTLPVSLMRMQIIHYFINSNGLLVRRVFGTRGAAFRDSIIAEHILSLQFRYYLNLRGPDGNVIQPVAWLANSTEQLSVRQVEVTVTAETPHPISTRQQQQLTMTTSTSMRNLQFRQALQPGVAVD